MTVRRAPARAGMFTCSGAVGLAGPQNLQLSAAHSGRRSSGSLLNIHSTAERWFSRNLRSSRPMGKREPIFRPGAAGFGKYFGAAYVDLVIGNYMTEAVFPTLLRQDLRGYFRRGTGSGWSRLRYALGQTLWTHHDSSTLQFNHSEIVGSVAAGVCRCQARRSSLHRYSRKYPQRVLAGSGAKAPSSQKMRFTMTRSQKLTNVVT